MTYKHLLLLAFLAFAPLLRAQQCYWVFLSDKQGASFDPYAYFDAHAIERYQRNGADLYAMSNYPVSPRYAQMVGQHVDEVVGESRWLNAIGVMATPLQVASLRTLPFVESVELIGEESHIASYASEEKDTASLFSDTLIDYLSVLKGEYFRRNGLDGKGVRIAVLDCGFSMVDTHPFFKHLRDSSQIIATWNFTKHSKDVYCKHNHGTQVLCCLAGLADSILHDSVLSAPFHAQRGLAPGADYLLAVTDYPYLSLPKEAIWWVMALEWADRNGADLVSNSLGFGKDRTYPDKMDGTSYVARAANMAAAKGLLVCSAAGNEGENPGWYTVVTPADADSVLTVGAAYLDGDLAYYSSLGPTADGRLKPNVCAPGEISFPSFEEYDELSESEEEGTSYATPIVAGFAACVLQLHRHYTAIQLKQEIERSASHYPYFDYAVGYGFPQADYFFRDTLALPDATFRFALTDTTVQLYLLRPDTDVTFCYKVTDTAHRILRYASRNYYSLDPPFYFELDNELLYPDLTLHLWFQGFEDSIRLSPSDTHSIVDTLARIPSDDYSSFNFAFCAHDSDDHFLSCNYYNIDTSDVVPQEDRTLMYATFTLGDAIPTSPIEQPVSAYSPAWQFALHQTYHLSRSYALGFSCGFGRSNHRLTSANPLDSYLLPVDDNAAYLKSRSLRRWNFELEIFQHVRLLAYKQEPGLFWDFGCYASVGRYRYRLRYNGTLDGLSDAATHTFLNPHFQDNNPIRWGFTTRLVLLKWGLYATYDMTGLFRHQSPVPAAPIPLDSCPLHLPRLQLGLVWNIM